MAKNYTKMAAEIVENIGGAANAKSVMHCLTRLRFTVRNKGKVKVDALKQVEGVINVIAVGDQYQVIIGTDVADVYEAVVKEYGIAEDSGSSTTATGIVTKAASIVGRVFVPFIGVFCAAGLIKGLLTLFTMYGGLDAASTTYTLLNAIGDGIFTFLPVFLAVTASKVFGANTYVSVAVACALVHPSISALFDMTGNSGPASFFGLPVPIISYTSSVMPIFIAVIFQSKLEPAVKKLLPKVVQSILLPFISLIVTALLTFLVIGPITNWVSETLANGIIALIGISPMLAGAVFGAIYPAMIIFGLHWGIIPIYFVNLAATGYDTILVFTVATNFAIAGAALGVSLKTKNRELKNVALPAFFSALVGGITEPAIYGCTLKFKWPFVIVCLVDAIGAALIGATNTVGRSTAGCNLLSIPALVAGSSIWTLWAICIGFFGACILTYFFGYNDTMLNDAEA